MFSCKQNSKRTVIHNVINNYTAGIGTETGTGTGTAELSAVYLLINNLQNQLDNINISPDICNTILETLSTNIELSFNEPSNTYYLDLSSNINLTNLTISNELIMHGSSIKFMDAANNVLTVSIPNLDASYNLKLPNTLGSIGQVIKLDTNGQLVFSDVSGVIADPVIEDVIINHQNLYLRKTQYRENTYNLYEALNIIKEGVIINYFSPPSTFYSNRNTYDNTSDIYIDTDNAEKNQFEYIIDYVNDKNLLNMTNFNIKSFLSYQSQENFILNYIDSFYRSPTPGFLNILANDYYLKTIDKAHYCLKIINGTVNDVSFLQYNKSFYDYIDSLNKDKLFNSINYNEIPVLTPLNLIPPYYMDFSGTDSIKPLYDTSYNSLYNFGNIEYEQNISLLQSINKTHGNNLTFYIYVQNTNNNDASFNDSVSVDNSNNSNNIYNIINNDHSINDFFSRNDNNQFYDYGNIMFALDNSINGSGSGPDSILFDCSINNIYIPDLNSLNNIYNDISNFNIIDFCTNMYVNDSLAETNNMYSEIFDSTAYTKEISFNDFNLINLSDLSLDPSSVSNIETNKNNVIFCPIQDCPFDFEINNANSYEYVRNETFVKSLYRYLILFGYFKTRNDFSLNLIISTNQTDTANLFLSDLSMGYSNFFNIVSDNPSASDNPFNIYLTYYDNINKIPSFKQTNSVICSNIHKLDYYDSQNNYADELINMITAYKINKNNSSNNTFIDTINDHFASHKSLALGMYNYIILYLTESIYKYTNGAENVNTNYIDFILQKLKPFNTYFKIRNSESNYYDNSYVQLIDNIFNNNINIDLSNQNIFDPNINFYLYKDLINYASSFQDLSDNLSYRDTLFLIYNSYNSNNSKPSNLINYNWNPIYLNKVNSYVVKEIYNKKTINYENIETVDVLQLSDATRYKLLSAWKNVYNLPHKYLTI